VVAALLVGVAPNDRKAVLLDAADSEDVSGDEAILDDDADDDEDEVVESARTTWPCSAKSKPRKVNV